MQTIFLPPRVGKTYALIDIAHRDGLYIITKDIKEARRVFELAQKVNKKVRFPMTYDDIKRGKFIGTDTETILIDDADEFIEFMCKPLAVRAIALTRREGDLY